MNIAMDMIVEQTADERQADVVSQLTGPFRTMGDKIRPEDINAPAWWHGDEEAYASVEGLAALVPQRR